MALSESELKERRRRLEEDHRRYWKFASRFQRSCMSNAKWRKVLAAIEASGIEITRCEYKWLHFDEIEAIDCAPQRNKYVASHFADGPMYPLQYKWLEWFRFPREYRPIPNVGHTVRQDVEALQQVVLNAADACVELDDQYLWLYGYRDERKS